MAKSVETDFVTVTVRESMIISRQEEFVKRHRNISAHLNYCMQTGGIYKALMAQIIIKELHRASERLFSFVRVVILK